MPPASHPRFPGSGDCEFRLESWALIRVLIERPPFAEAPARLECKLLSRSGETAHFVLSDAEVENAPPVVSHGSLLLFEAVARGWDVRYPYHLHYVDVDGDALPLARARNLQWLE